MTVRAQAIELINTMPDNVIRALIEYMTKYQQESNTAEDKFSSVMTYFEQAKKNNDVTKAREEIKHEYGSLTDALTGILKNDLSLKKERDEYLKEKYELNT